MLAGVLESLVSLVGDYNPSGGKTVFRSIFPSWPVATMHPQSGPCITYIIKIWCELASRNAVHFNGEIYRRADDFAQDIVFVQCRGE